MDTSQLIGTLVAEGARRPLPNPLKQASAWLAGTLLYVTALTEMNGVRPDIADKLASPLFILELILLFAMASTAAYSALCLSRPDSGQRPWLQYVPLGLTVLWAVTAFASAAPASLADILHSLAAGQFDCPRHILMLGVPPSAAMFLIIRKGATIRCCWAGGMAGLAAISLGYLSMRVIEPNDSAAHLIVWHALPTLLICVAGMMIGRMMLRWR